MSASDVDTARTRIEPTPRLLLFDLDDTLCDYATARARRLRIAFNLDRFAEVGATGRDIERMIADSLATQPHGTDHFPTLFSRHGIDDPRVADAAMTWYRDNRFHGLDLFADAAPTLAKLRLARDSSGRRVERRIGVVTNGPADVQRAKVELLGILDLVDFVVISGEFGAWKPDPAIFHEALRLGEATPEESVFIGDSAEHDMAGARAAGIRTIWMNRSGIVWNTAEPEPDQTVRNVAELVALLSGAES